MTEGLIIDDNRTTADALGQMLAVLGFKTRLAYGSNAAMSIPALHQNSSAWISTCPVSMGRKSLPICDVNRA
jgi:PleD family two-component response regulator